LTLLGSRLAPVAAAVLCTGCDPIINVYGSFFPAWLICLVVGLVLAGILRWLFAKTRLEPHLGPLVLVYPALAFLLSCVIWLLAYGP
jgi:hypothetical protein